MKKTLVALTVAAFAATSANAFTAYEKDGTTFELDGQIRLLLSQQSKKTTTGSTVSSQQRAHTNLANNGSRLGFSINHTIADDFYARARYETRFSASAENAAGWGQIVTSEAYVGLGGRGHEVTFGNQTVIGDEIGQAGFDKVYGVGSQNIGNKKFAVLTADSASAVNYAFTGVKGLKVGANYNFANERTDTEVNVNSAKSGFGVGAIYTFDLAEKNSLTVSAGYTHDDYATGNTNKKDKDGIYFGAKYKLEAFTVAVDGGQGVVKTKTSASTSKDTLNFVRTGARYDVLSNAGVYGNYSYGTVKTTTSGSTASSKVTAHQFMLGADYKPHKQVVTFVEGRVIKSKDTAEQKYTDKAVGVGLRVLF